MWFRAWDSLHSHQQYQNRHLFQASFNIDLLPEYRKGQDLRFQDQMRLCRKRLRSSHLLRLMCLEHSTIQHPSLSSLIPCQEGSKVVQSMEVMLEWISPQAHPLGRPSRTPSCLNIQCKNPNQRKVQENCLRPMHLKELDFLRVQTQRRYHHQTVNHREIHQL